MQSKRETTEIVNAMLEPIRERRKLYSSDPAELDRLLKDGAERASAMAEATMQIVRETMKFI